MGGWVGKTILCHGAHTTPHEKMKEIQILKLFLSSSFIISFIFYHMHKLGRREFILIGYVRATDKIEKICYSIYSTFFLSLTQFLFKEY